MFSGCSVADLVSSHHFLTTVVEVEASAPPHVLKLWFVRKGVLPVNYFCSKKASVSVGSFCLCGVYWITSSGLDYL